MKVLPFFELKLPTFKVILSVSHNFIMLVPPAGFGIAEEGIYRCSKVETLNLSFLETLNLKTILFIGGQEPSKFFKEFFNRSSIEWSLLRIADLSSASPTTTLDQRRRMTRHPNRSTSSNMGTEKGTNPNDQTESNNNSSTHENHNSTIDDTIERMGTDNNQGPTYILNDSADLMLIKSTCLGKAFKKLLNSANYNILLVDKTALVIGILRKIQKWNISSILNEYRLYSGKHSSYFAETFLELIDIRIEQSIDTDENGDNSLIPNSSDNLNVMDQIPQRKLSNVVVVTEDDLCKPPEVPRRLINMIQEAERNEQLQLLRKTNDSLIRKLDRKESDLGIFGNKYRLAFNKQENGRYEYYKSYKVRCQSKVRSNTTGDISKELHGKSHQNGIQKEGNRPRIVDNEESYVEDDDEDVVTLTIPKESLLPSWFIYQRDIWEKDNVPDVHHFYKEHIFV